MELFKIGGPNPDTNYLFMGKSRKPVSMGGTNYMKAIMLIVATSQLKP